MATLCRALHGLVLLLHVLVPFFSSPNASFLDIVHPRVTSEQEGDEKEVSVFRKEVSTQPNTLVSALDKLDLCLRAHLQCCVHFWAPQGKRGRWRCCRDQ